MSVTAPSRLTADEFIARAMDQPEGTHSELDGDGILRLDPPGMAIDTPFASRD